MVPTWYDKPLGSVLGPKDATAVGLAKAAFLDDGQDDRRLVVVDADEVVVKLAQEVLRVPQGLGS